MAIDKMAPAQYESDEKMPQTDHIDVLKAEALNNPDILNDAYEGEDREHQQGMWEAVKAHPKACLWAFCMCFTIVGLLPKLYWRCQNASVKSHS